MIATALGTVKDAAAHCATFESGIRHSDFVIAKMWILRYAQSLP
jgi:hypothetical protein